MLPMSMTRNAVGIVIVALLAVVNAQNCMPMNFGYGSVVCACNSTYCDSVAVTVPERGQYSIYESGKSGRRMSQRIASIDNGTSDDNDINTITLTLNPNRTYQTINGFGGAFTDAAGINILKLSQGAQDMIIDSYFGENGSRYTLGRVPIGGTDFSTRPYSYDDVFDDFTLGRFELQREDHKYKIPFMQKALAMNPELRFVAAAWSAPPWMKTNDRAEGFGFLKKEFYQTYADYLVKFLNAYKEHGLKIWAISTGNEPTDALAPFIIKFETMGWTPSTMAEWVANNLGPTIAASASNDTIIVMLDDQRFDLPWYVVDVFKNPLAERYIAGIASHWYWDTIISPQVLDSTHVLYPNKFLLMTEACAGSNILDIPKVRLGDWSRGEKYILSIMENLNHWMSGWIDWNLVLDRTGGPNWVGNFVDSPIIVNPETDEFFKQPTFYALAHFSKFIKPGSVRIGITSSHSVTSTAFSTPDNDTVVVLYNRWSIEKKVTVIDSEQGNIPTTIPPYSIQTIIYRR